MPVETEAWHAEATEFHHDVRARRHSRDAASPRVVTRLGQAATVAMPRRPVASASVSRLAYGPTRVRPPTWFEIIVRSGMAWAKVTNSGSWGKYRVFSRHSPRRASTRAPVRN